MTDPTRISDDQHNNAHAVPQGWTDADSDSARLALELECLLMDTKDLSVVSKWWASANEALELHRQRLAATPAPAPAQEPAPTWSLREALQKAKDALSLALSDVDWRKDSPTQPVIHKAYNCAHQALALPTAEQVDDINVAESFTSVTKTAAPAQGEPFGYFRAEPFGWTDCAKDDEGAIALYERPQEVGLTDEEIEAIAKKHMSTVGDHWCNEDAIRERHAEDFARAIIAAIRAKGGK